jgi:general secretion pathway protein K
MNYNQNGIALILVLWVTMLLTVIAGSFVFSMRTDTTLALNARSTAQAEAYADAGIQRGVYELFKPASDRTSWKNNKAYYRWRYGDASYIDIRLTDLSGRIDINRAPYTILHKLIAGTGLDEEETNILVNRIRDWLDTDDQKRENGAEFEDYLAQGLSYGPANGPFQVLDELELVLGMTPQLYARLKSSLTVNSHESGINPKLASRQVLMAIPGITAEIVDDYILLRDEALKNNRPIPELKEAARILARYSGVVYSVRATAVMNNGAIFIRDAVVEIVHGKQDRVVFHTWKEGDAPTS